jgi:hypothetical protein
VGGGGDPQKKKKKEKKRKERDVLCRGTHEITQRSPAYVCPADGAPRNIVSGKRSRDHRTIGTQATYRCKDSTVRHCEGERGGGRGKKPMDNRTKKTPD